MKFEGKGEADFTKNRKKGLSHKVAHDRKERQTEEKDQRM